MRWISWWKKLHPIFKFTSLRTHPCPLSIYREGYDLIELNAGGLFYTSIFVFCVPPLSERSEKRGGQGVSSGKKEILIDLT